jgi:hypothetical protein
MPGTNRFSQWLLVNLLQWRSGQLNSERRFIMRRMLSIALAALALTTTLAAVDTDNSLGT